MAKPRVIAVNISNNGWPPGNPAYLSVFIGGASNGLFQVTNVIDSAHFIVTNTFTWWLQNGSCCQKKAVHRRIPADEDEHCDQLLPGRRVLSVGKTSTSTSPPARRWWDLWVVVTMQMTHFTVQQ